MDKSSANENFLRVQIFFKFILDLFYHGPALISDILIIK